MPRDTFPGLDADCGDLIRRCQGLMLSARRVRAAIATGDVEELKRLMGEINHAGAELQQLTDGFVASSIEVPA